MADTRPWGANVVAFPSTYIAEVLRRWPEAFPAWNDDPEIVKLRNEWNFMKVRWAVLCRAEAPERPQIPMGADGMRGMAGGSHYEEAGERERSEKKPKKPTLDPAPNAPKPKRADFTLPVRNGKNDYHKEPSRIFIYRNADESVHSVAARFDFADGSKTYRSYYWGEGNGRAPGWVEQHHPNPVLYRLPEVLAGISKGKTVVFLEGEKDVDGAVDRGLEKDGYIFTTTPNGAAFGRPWEKVDYAPVAGVRVIVVPDPDAPGYAWGKGVIDCAAKAGATVRKGTIPEWTNGNGKAWGFGDKLPFSAMEEDVLHILTGAKATEFPLPLVDGELTPVMELLDKALLTAEAIPPMRSISGWPIEIELREPAGLHELTAEGANDDEAEQSRLPAPKSRMLTRHNRCTLALLIERYVRFHTEVAIKDKKTGKRTGETFKAYKRLPGEFLPFYCDYKQSKLPKVSGLMTMPIVLPDGKLLASNGLDRKLQTVFCIDPGIADLLPKGVISEGQIMEAMKFLTDEWLVDVPTDYAGKCTLIALALSVLERQLFAERPAFFITAGKRGCGKTTAATMIALALFGKRAAAAAWSPNEEERRKAVFAAMLQSVPMIVWDNIKLGTAVSCPTIEKTLTAPDLEDRVLGESRIERASCATIQAFTGNNIMPKGDMASRSLNIRLSTNRPDPENRDFTHPDPFEWTLAHRGEIIRALYTILLGNPRFKQALKSRAAAKTRFKQWWHLVGAPIEHAAGLALKETRKKGGDTTGMDIDFGKLFFDTEAEDEESASLAEVLDILGNQSGWKTFRASEVAGWTELGSDKANTLRDFLTPRDARHDAKLKLSPRIIGRRLMANIDAPVWLDEKTTLTLRGELDPHNKTMVFEVEHKVKGGEEKNE